MADPKPAEQSAETKAALAAQTQKFNTAFAAKEAEAKAAKEALEQAKTDLVAAREAAEAEATELREKLESTSGDTDKSGPTEATADTKLYRLEASLFCPTVSAPGKPFEFKTYTKGDLVPLDPEQAERLLESGDVTDPDAPAPKPGEAGGQTKAPGEPDED